MLGNYSETTRRTVFLARYEASRLGLAAVDTPQLLLGIFRVGDEEALELLAEADLTIDEIRARVGGQRAVPGTIGSSGELPLTEECQRVIDAATEESQIGFEGETTAVCLLLGILHHPACAAAAILTEHGLDLDRARLKIEEIARRGAPEPAALPHLEEFGRDLTAIAARQGFDPLIGRERELDHILQILAQRLKSNPVLVGEPGVGKTAVVEGLAQRIAQGAVPAPLAKKRIIALNLSSLIAGTKFRGQFEERLKGVLDELRSSRNLVVFIDEIHTLVGTGAADGALDAANILKPALANGELSCVGATTPKEFRKFIEKDRALLRRFQRVDLEPPTATEAIEILDGVRGRYESFHGLRYSPEALRTAVYLTDRYITERHLPDKAIDVLDQAGARLKLTGWGSEEELVVGRKEVEEIIARTTGIPAVRIEAGEAGRLRQMESSLSQWVVGQESAIRAISKAIRRSRLGVRNPRRPIGSFLFAGSSGVGKTEVARRLAEFLFDREDALIRFDMSEYMERHTVAKLIGSPPGYVGYEEGGQLTERIRREPYSVVLFDEIEKAHPDIANILLQILEDGRLTDSDGNVVSFTNTVVLLTSNVGSRRLVDDKHIGFGGDTAAARRERIEADLKDELKRVFRPEFLDRLDELITFDPLGRPELLKIVDLQLRDLNQMLAEQGFEVRLSDEAKSWVLDKAEVGRASGARPLRRAIQRFVQDPISEEMIRWPEGGFDAIDVSVEGTELQISPSSAPSTKNGSEEAHEGVDRELSN